jgi:hypothetical protein
MRSVLSYILARVLPKLMGPPRRFCMRHMNTPISTKINSIGPQKISMSSHCEDEGIFPEYLMFFACSSCTSGVIVSPGTRVASILTGICEGVGFFLELLSFLGGGLSSPVTLRSPMLTCWNFPALTSDKKSL